MMAVLPTELIEKILLLLPPVQCFRCTVALRLLHARDQCMTGDRPQLGMDEASKRGLLELLGWWRNAAAKRVEAPTCANQSGDVAVLQWWNSSLEIEWSSLAMDLASFKGHISVLRWWVNSDIPERELKWTNRAMDWASDGGHV